MAGKDEQPTLASLLQKRRPSRLTAKGPAQMSLLMPAPAFRPAADAFDSRPRGAYSDDTTSQQAEPAKEPVRYTVRQLLNEVRGAVERTYPGMISVEGELSNCRPAGSGHLYFTLKDGDAQLAVVMFRARASLLGFKIRDGLQVDLRGRLSIYETRGQLQMVAETMRPRGEGALQLAFEQLKRKLAAEGLFDAARKRPLPPFPHCIGIVTATSGAALRDIIQVVRRRHARLNLLVYPAVVQGPQCGPSVAAGIRWFNAHPERVDLILIARGGGSVEDLAGFNDEALAHTIHASQLPIVSAVGHEIDTSIADLVADLRAPTPSAAAELITSAQHRVADRIASLDRRMERAGQFQMMRARQRFSHLSAEQVLARLRDAILLRGQRIDDLRQRLALASERQQRVPARRVALLETRLRRQAPVLRLGLAQRRLAELNSAMLRAGAMQIALRRRRMEQASVRLQALSPLAVLERGYAIVYGPDGEILRSAAKVAAGAEIRARLAAGSLRAVIQEAVVQDEAQEKERA